MRVSQGDLKHGLAVRADARGCDIVIVAEPRGS
jgi:hypothetical protein